MAIRELRRAVQPQISDRGTMDVACDLKRWVAGSPRVLVRRQRAPFPISRTRLC